MAGVRALLAISLFTMVAVVPTNGQCYLLDSDATCEVCWKTSYADNSDKVGVTVVSECPDGVTEAWQIAPPDKMIALISYKVEWKVDLNLTAFPVLRPGADAKHIPHANIHSCITSRGVCSPFVANSPGLATHTKALKSDLAIAGNDGSVTFSADVSLTEEQYTIIAHVRFYVPHDDPSRPDVKYDVAIGASRNVLPQTTLCDPGSIYVIATDTCRVCPAGTHQEGLNCSACSKGTYAPVEGLSACIPCEEGYTDVEGQTECKACPLRTQRRPSSAGVDISECLCVMDSYAKNGQGSSCHACPAGATCPGGLDRPFPQPGFWGDVRCEFDGKFGNSSCPHYDMFLECNPPTDCAGGPEFSCAEGHSGHMCKEALPGWFIVGGSFWLECGETGHFVGVIGILAVVLVWLTINKVASGNYDAMDIALLFVQITGMISTFGLKWHSNLSIVNTALGIANFDVDFVTPLCLGKWTGIDSFYVQLTLPLLYAIGCVIYYGTGYLWSRYLFQSTHTFEEFKTELKVNLINKPASFILVMYHTLCLKCFQSFRCEELPDGRLFMKFAPDIECWKPDHYAMVVISCLYIPTVLIGFPGYLAYIVKRASGDASMHEADFMSKFSFVFSRYDPGYKWWDAVLTFRRFAVALISVTFDTSLLQAALTIVLLVVLLTFHTHARPFVSDQIDTLEVFTICGSIFYALAGMLFYPSITADAQGYICTDDKLSACTNDLSLKNAISIVLVSWIVATLVYSFWVSYLCVVEVNNSAKANKVMKSMLGIANKSRSFHNGSFHSGAAALGSRRSLPSSSAVAKIIAVSKIIGATKRKESSNSPSVNNKQTQNEEEAGEQVSLFSENFAAAWSASSNRMTLEKLVDGRDMLRWARKIENLGTRDKRMVMRDFEVTTLGLLALERDVTHFAETEYADTCRVMATYDGVVDYLTCCPQGERVAVAKFMEGYAVFTEERSKMGEKGRPKFPMHSICVPEHAAVVVSFLVNSNREDVQRFANVMRDIALLKEGREIESTPSFHSSLINVATKTNTISPVDVGEEGGNVCQAASSSDGDKGSGQVDSAPGPATATDGGEIQEEITAESTGVRNGVQPQAPPLLNDSKSGHVHFDCHTVG